MSLLIDAPSNLEFLRGMGVAVGIDWHPVTKESVKASKEHEEMRIVLAWNDAQIISAMAYIAVLKFERTPIRTRFHRVDSQ